MPAATRYGYDEKEKDQTSTRWRTRTSTEAFPYRSNGQSHVVTCD